LIIFKFGLRSDRGSTEYRLCAILRKIINVLCSGPLGFAARARFWATGGGAGSAAETASATAAAAGEGAGADKHGAGRIIVLHDPEVRACAVAELRGTCTRPVREAVQVARAYVFRSDDRNVWLITLLCCTTTEESGKHITSTEHTSTQSTRPAHVHTEHTSTQSTRPHRAHVHTEHTSTQSTSRPGLCP